MKLLLVFLFSSLNIIAIAQCGTGSAKINNPSRDVIMTDKGHIFSNWLDGKYSQSYCIIDNDTLPIELNNLKGVWVGGYDENNSPKCCATSYWNNQSDYYPGPIRALNGEPYGGSYCEWQKSIWTFSGSKLSYLKSRFDKLELQESDIPFDYWSYPAKGNKWYTENLGFSLDEDIAPFWDRNFDDIYNPMDGDLPIPIQESPNFFPYQFSYTVINDLSGSHVISQGHAMHLELQMINYLVNSKESKLENKSIFTRIICKNKGPYTYANAKLGFYEDVNYGHGANDYTACFSDLNTIVSYRNENDPVSSTLPEGEETAVHFTKILNQDLYAHIVHGSTVLQTNPALVRPSIVDDYIRMLNGFWKDGTPITRGGNGYDSLSTDETKFVFDGCPLDSTAWHMLNSNLRFDDYISLTSINLENFAPNEERIIDLVETIIYEPDTPDLEIVCNIQPYVEEVDEYYNDIISGLITAVSPLDLINDIKVIPNPSNDNLRLVLDNKSSNNFSVNIFDADGKVVFSKRNFNVLNSIDVSSLLHGLYFVQIKGDTFFKTIKFIKN